MIFLVLPDSSDDHRLLLAARQGNKQALTQIYQLYLEPIYQFVRLRVGTSQDAEDIASGVFLTFIDAVRRGKGPHNNLRAWLYKVARNAVYDYYGKRDRELPMETIEMTFTDESPGPEMQIIEAVSGESLRKALQKLNPEQQEVILLRFDQMLSLQETADVMNKNLNTIKTLQFRAINRLRELIQQQELSR